MSGSGPRGLSKAQGGHGHHEAFILTHDVLAGNPLYTADICVVPCPRPTPCCHPPEGVQAFHSGTETAMDKSSSAFPTTAQSTSVVLLGHLHQGMVNVGKS